MSRQGNFAAGVVGEPSSLIQQSNQFNQEAPHGFTPNGVGQPIMLSPNGMSANDAKRDTPNGMLPSPNGMSQSTYNSLDPQIGTRLPF